MQFIDPVTIRIDVSFEALGSGILGSADIATVGESYLTIKAALAADATSAADAMAVASLPGGSSLQFRTNSAGGAVVLDHDGSTPYFSLDGGATNLARFSTGQFNGDGRQASHWKDNLGLGIMDPTFARGELGILTALEIQALDVIGWNLASSAVVPEPATAVLLLLGGLALVVFQRRKHHSASGMCQHAGTL